MNVLRAYASKSYWKHGFSAARAVAALLSAFGTLWLVVEITAFFAPQTRSSLASLWPGFLLAGFVAALWINRPLQEVHCKLAGRDISLTISVGDLFKEAGALVIGSNRTFDTDTSRGLISPRSVQGQFTERYYNSTAHLDADITATLADTPGEAPVILKPGKQLQYAIGTVAKVMPKSRTAYLLAVAHLNGHGVANATFDDLKTALPSLWEFIANAGSVEPIVMPVLGTGFSRLPEPREEVIREIIKSFVAACSDRRFTGSLRIVMHPRDFYSHGVDLDELGRYLHHVCKYTQFGMTSRVGVGVPA